MQQLRILIKCLILFLSQTLLAQEEVLENWSNSTEDGLQEEDLHYLLQLKSHPIDLNSCELEDLMRIPGMNPLFAQNIIGYREKNGDYQSVYELQIIDLCDLDWLRQNQTYFTCNQALSFNRSKAKHNLLVRWKPDLLPKAGYNELNEKRFLANRHAYYMRYRGEFGKNLNAGLSLERDAGEPILIDHLGFFLKYKQGKGIIREFVLGDYQLILGQGLLFSSARQIFAGEVSDGIRAWSGIQAMASSNEQFFQRGIASSFAYRKSILNIAVSRKRLDAKLKNDGSYTIYQSGLHRNGSELATKKKLVQKQVFSSFITNWNKLRLGINHTASRVGNAKIQQGMSLDFRYLFTSAYSYGELAITRNIKKGLIGHLWSLDEKNDLHLRFNFETNFQYQINQSRLSLNWSHKVLKKEILKLFLTHIQSSVFQFRNDAPAKAYEASAIYQIPKRLPLPTELRLKAETFDRNTEASKEKIRMVERIKALRFRIQTILYESEFFTCKWRSEFTRFASSQKEKGQLHYLDFGYSSKSSKLSFRYTYFNTASFDTRIYTYERDVLYSFSVPAFQGMGQRVYLMINQKLRGFSLSARYGLSWFPENILSGSGPDAYTSDYKQDFKLQITKSW